MGICRCVTTSHIFSGRTGVRLFRQVATKREEGGMRERCSGRDLVENITHKHTQPRQQQNQAHRQNAMQSRRK
jgi:hypothetical protein